MEVFRDLYIVASADEMAAAVARIEKDMPRGWARDKVMEERALSGSLVLNRLAYSFACEADGPRSAAIVVLAQKDPATFFVSNIVPRERHQLSHAQYNAVLEDFYSRVFKPYADNAGLRCELTGPEVGLEHWMSQETAELLRSFSTLANRGTGSSHPTDKKRWNDFVLSAYRTGSTLDSSTLARWLIEAEDWPPPIAEQLALEYEYGRELLAFAGVPKVA